MQLLTELQTQLVARDVGGTRLQSAGADAAATLKRAHDDDADRRKRQCVSLDDVDELSIQQQQQQPQQQQQAQQQQQQQFVALPLAPTTPVIQQRSALMLAMADHVKLQQMLAAIVWQASRSQQ